MKPDRCGRHDDWLHVLVLGRIVRAQAGKDRVHLPGGLLHGPPLTQPALEEQPSCSPLVEPRFPRLVVRTPSHAGELEGVDHRDRNPEVRDDARDGSTHAPRRDPDDGVAAAAQLKRLAQRAGLPAELALPETVADHDHRGTAARALLVRGKTPAGRRRDAEHFEVIGADRLPRHQSRPLAARENGAHERVRGNSLEGVRALADRQVVRVRARQLGIIRDAGVDLDQALRLTDWGAAQEHGVDHTEQRGGQPDAERQRRDRGEREPGLVNELTESVSKISDKCHGALRSADSLEKTGGNLQPVPRK